MEPRPVAHVAALIAQRVGVVLLQPAVEIEEVVLLAPQHRGQCLAHHGCLVRSRLRRRDRGVELVGLGDPRREQAVDVVDVLGTGGAQPELDDTGALGGDLQLVEGCRLRPGAPRMDGIDPAAHDVLVKGVLDVRRGVGRPPQPLGVRLVLGEQQLRRAVATQLTATDVGVVDGDHRWRVADGPHRALVAAHPPRVAEPQRRQQVNGCHLGAAVGHRDAHLDVLRVALGVLHVDVDEAVVVECPRVEQLVLEVEPASIPVRGDEVVVRIAVERIAVAELQIGARRRGVEVEVVLLDVLAVIAFGVGEPEHPLLEDRIDAVPHGDPEAQLLTVVTEPGDAVLAPLVGTRARLIVGEVAPGIAVVAVVLAHRAPLAFTEVRAPTLPRGPTRPRRLETIGFDAVGHGAAQSSSADGA